MRRNDRRLRRKYARMAGEELDPMNYVSNLSDVMLILAVGIMLALIILWYVEIDTAEASGQEDSEASVELSDEDLTGQGDMPEDTQRMGDVYYDEETGTYYIVPDGED